MSTVALQHASCGLPADRFRRVLTHVLSAEGVAVRHLALVVASRETVQDLHRRYLNRDEAHRTCCAFDYGSEQADSSETSGTAQAVDGEIYIDFDTARERCREFGADEEGEAMRYAVHGLLHLMGYRDKSPADKARMRGARRSILARNGIFFGVRAEKFCFYRCILC